MSSRPPDPPLVAVWRTAWLPGSETFIRDHVTALRRWRPLLLGLRRLADGLDVVPARAPYGDAGLRRLAWSVGRRTGYLGAHDDLLLRRRPRLVHAHFGPDAVEVLPICRRHRLPLVVTFHGYDLSSELHTPHAEHYRARLADLFGYASLLLPVSHELERRLLELGAPPAKVQQHYLGVDLDRPGSPPRQEREGIVYVGRLIPRKGVADLIEAVALLPEALRTSTPVTIIGDGPERERLQRRAAEVPGARIHFRGRQPPEVVADALAGAAVFCGPSRTVAEGDTEAFGLVFLEAARAATPAVGYRHGGVVEAVVDGETGLLAAEGDVAGLRDRLVRLLHDPALAARLGAAGERRLRMEFDLRRQTEILETRYDEVLTQPVTRKARP